MMLLARELSLTPSNSTHVTSMTIANAGTLRRIGNAAQSWRGVEQRAHSRIGAQRDGSIAVCEPVGKGHTEAAHERSEVTAPCHGDSDVPHGVLEDQIPANDPGNQFAQGGVGIGVGAAGLRNHSGQFRVAEGSQPAHHSQQNEREDQCGPGRGADDRSVGPNLAGGSGTDRREDAGADDRTDRQHDEIAGAQDAPERMRALDRLKIGDRFSSEKTHAGWEFILSTPNSLGSRLSAPGSLLGWQRSQVSREIQDVLVGQIAPLASSSAPRPFRSGRRP